MSVTLDFPAAPTKTETTGRIERAILGSILLQPRHFAEAAERLKPDDFFDDWNRRIFRTMAALAADNVPIDSLSVTTVLAETRQLASVGGSDYLSRLLDGVPDRPNITWQISTLLEHSKDKRFDLALVAAQGRRAAGEHAEAIAPDHAEKLLEIEATASNRTTFCAREFMPDVLKELQAQASAGGLVGLPTGIDSLNEVTGGLRAGELTVIGALPGAGKTALACQVIAANGQAANPTGVFSAEMTNSDLARRLLCATTRVSANRIRHPNLIQKDDWGYLAEGAAQIAEWPVWYDDRGSIDVGQLVSKARLWIARMGVKLIVVDYLQLIRADGNDTRERVSKVADALRQLAKAEHVSVVLLSQLRRPQDLNDLPTMIQLKESGDIEAHAHCVLLLRCPLGSNGQPTGEDLILIGKNRNGVRGALPVTFNTHKLQFFPRTERTKSA